MSLYKRHPLFNKEEKYGIIIGMEFIHTLSSILLYQPSTPSIVIFVLSTLLLLAGLAIKIWSHAFRWSFLDAKDLSWVERVHPHLPSPGLIIAITLCSVTLFATALQTMQGVFPFTDPYQGLNIASFFLLGSALGILGELKWKGAGEYTAAILAGTAVAFLILGISFGTADKTMTEKALMLLFLLPSIVLTGYLFISSKQTKFLLASTAALVFWMVLYSVQR